MYKMELEGKAKRVKQNYVLEMTLYDGMDRTVRVVE